MAALRAVSRKDAARPAATLFDRIGAFLRDQRLDPDPVNYAFAHHLLVEPDGPLARAVAELTYGGVRLTRRDIESLGCGVLPAPQGPAPETDAGPTRKQAEGLVASTQMQVEGFEDMVHAMRAEAQGFGRDLAESAAAIDRSRSGGGNGGASLDDVARITAGMLERVRVAETRLDAATREAADLRTKLEEARDNARRDPLTDLPNRRAFEEAYAAQMGAAQSVCIAVCDVDHFKSVNDRFGHAVGDRVLKAIAEALSQSCPGHLVARYGGEEFAILFSGISHGAALATLDRARATVAAKRYRLRDSDEPLGAITFSAGITQAHPDEDYAHAYQRADALLYDAKANGRNQVRSEK
ncbi:GGDEF domain-containing protein [Stakelama tenebrarum]|uniref:diguanylate cyclase n=1 Tax=Stakelama tenebrarum TaxID=2711215 RepID=A0A6G6Y2E8_9SPHN|nr:GGDEF domain-containing protein [Sphingosinithalassobacter tenebrarum]QIG78783.1 GGDEF domain-containing protein [Sphingosinithalassobacter tenebrarum]